MDDANKKLGTLFSKFENQESLEATVLADLREVVDGMIWRVLGVTVLFNRTRTDSPPSQRLQYREPRNHETHDNHVQP